MAAAQPTDTVTEAPATAAAPGANLAEASRIITSATKWSAATGIIPVPVIDLVALAAVQGKMVGDLTKLYGHTASKEAVRGVVSVLLGVLLPGVGASYITGSLARGVPVAGAIVGIVSFGALGSAATYAVGKIFVRHFEGGGTFSNFNIKDVEADLKREFGGAVRT